MPLIGHDQPKRGVLLGTSKRSHHEGYPCRLGKTYDKPKARGRKLHQIGPVLESVGGMFDDLAKPMIARAKNHDKKAQQWCEKHQIGWQHV